MPAILGPNLTAGDTRKVPVKVCPKCGAVGEYAGLMRPCPKCRGEL